MNVQDALTKQTTGLPITTADIILALAKAKLDGSDEFDPDVNGKAIDLAFARLLWEMVYPTEVKEDDVSLKYLSEAAIARIVNGIYNKYGLVNPYLAKELKPIVKQVRFW